MGWILPLINFDRSSANGNLSLKPTSLSRRLDDYLLRLFAIAFTKRRPNQIKRTTYAASSQIRAIRKKMVEIIQREASSCTLSQLTTKLIPEVIGREIEKSTQGIYPLQNVRLNNLFRFPTRGLFSPFIDFSVRSTFAKSSFSSPRNST